MLREETKVNKRKVYKNVEKSGNKVNNKRKVYKKNVERKQG